MKRLAPLVMLAAAVLIAVGLVVRHRNPATPYTDDRAAWQAYEQGDAMLQAYRYDRAEEQCPRCGYAVERIVQGQRSTYFCPVCQEEINKLEEKQDERGTA